MVLINPCSSILVNPTVTILYILFLLWKKKKERMYDGDKIQMMIVERKKSCCRLTSLSNVFLLIAIYIIIIKKKVNVDTSLWLYI
jgi:hypothetical protein